MNLLSSWWKRTIAFIALVLFFYLPSLLIVNLIPEVNFFISLLAASILIEKKRITQKYFSFGLEPDNRLIFGLATGFLWAMAVMSLFLIFGIILKDIRLVSVNNSGYFFLVSLLILINSVSEELFYRGIIFQSLIQRFSPNLIICISSILFSVFHLFNSGFSLLPFVNTFLAGILLSVFYLKTKSLWLPISAHFFWNWNQAILLGSPVSGFDFQIAIFSADLNKYPTFLFGGSYGIEGGILTTVILLISIILSLKYLEPKPEISAFNFRRDYLESLNINF